VSRIDWPAVLDRAAEIVAGYSTGVTLRQLHYRLVSAQVIPNTTSAYKTLSARTAEARREDRFPSLVDRTRAIHRPAYADDPQSELEWLAQTYRRDRTENQERAVYIGVEKNGLLAQLESWFSGLGIPILALGGYSSQTFCDVVAADVRADGRESVLIYGGDFDPSGEDIERDFGDRTDLCFDDIVRVALTPEQVQEYELPPQPGKATDTRAGGFIAKHGSLVQVEIDALPPDVLRSLYQEAIDRYWDRSTYEAVLLQEAHERDVIERFRYEFEAAS
jgi:hypothetical protein